MIIHSLLPVIFLQMGYLCCVVGYGVRLYSVTLGSSLWSTAHCSQIVAKNGRTDENTTKHE